MRVLSASSVCGFVSRDALRGASLDPPRWQSTVPARRRVPRECVSIVGVCICCECKAVERLPSTITAVKAATVDLKKGQVRMHSGCKGHRCSGRLQVGQGHRGWARRKSARFAKTSLNFLRPLTVQSAGCTHIDDFIVIRANRIPGISKTKDGEVGVLEPVRR